MRARACAICVASIASDWLPLWTLRVLSGIEVPHVTGHDDQHLMWGALIRRSFVCGTPAPAPAPLSLRDDRVEGATTELTAVGGPRVRISLPPAESRLRTSF